MTINGKERNFMFGSYAYFAIQDMCPGKKIKNLKQLFTNEVNILPIAMILNRNAEMNNKLHGLPYNEPLTTEELWTLTPKELGVLMDEVVDALSAGFDRSIEAEEIKDSKNA